MATKNKKPVHPAVKAVKALHRHAKDHFIPHEGNNHVPHVLKHRVLLGYSIALVLLKAVVISTSLILPAASVYSGAITKPNIIELTNQARQAQGLLALKTNTRLASAAQAKAEDMLEKQYFAHTSPEGTTPWYWIKKAGYSYSISGENLAIHYNSAEGALAGWLASASHRSNIMNTKFTETGVGITEGMFEGYPSVIVVQMFGRPATTNTVEEPKTTASPTVANSIQPNTTSTPNSDDIKVPTLPTSETEANPDTPPDEQITGPNTSTAPKIDDSSIKVVPNTTGYSIQLSIANASSVIAQAGGEQLDMTQSQDGKTWRADITIDQKTAAPEGEKVNVAAWNGTGQKTGGTVALIAPAASAQELYAFASPNTEAPYRLFGVIPLEGLGDQTRQIYLLTMIFLVGCLLISILVKVHIQKPTVIFHTVVVIGLSALLFRL
ncbi:MAG: CAP domain-containing protein [Patescibacteria group bacterium]|nr:CAP domain-containing protein [Patescibacteria group bacterium]